MRVVFATTAKDRTQHISRTLPKNLADNKNATFVLLDYCDREGLRTYLVQNHWVDIIRERLVVYSYTKPGPFHMTHSKNVAHRCGIMEGADVLCNLDADNFTGVGFDQYVEKQFSDDGVFLWAGVVQGQGRKLRGCSGRIAVSSKAFLKAGGYDEKYDTWSPDDKDFNARLQRLGYTPKEIDRQYLEAIPHGNGIRFKEYPHVQPEGGWSDEPELTPSEATVVNFGNFGCGTVYRNFQSTPIELKPVPTRIFGIGMHKTATNSLHSALKILGYDSAHWESGNWARDIWQEMKSLGRSRTLERHYALSDIPINILYKELDKAYPGSKFILTIRDEAKWLHSVRNHWKYTHNRFRWEWDVYPFTNRIHKAIYGRTNFNEETMLSTYRRHNKDVVEYFKGRSDFLILDMSAGAGWKELCPFLLRPVPSVPYPVDHVTRWRVP